MAPSTSRMVHQIDLSTMNDEDLKALRQGDAFMYYSIPGIIKAFRCNLPIDHSTLLTSTQSGDAAAGSAKATTSVSRQTRISDSCDLMTVMNELRKIGTKDDSG